MASSGRLKPGEQGTISVKINTSGRTGQLTKTVQVFSNDPAKKILTLVIKAFIRPQ